MPAEATAVAASRSAGGVGLSALRRGGTGLLLPVLLLAIWQLSAAQQWLPRQILPAPLEVWQSAVDLWASGDLPHHVGISRKRPVSHV